MLGKIFPAEALRSKESINKDTMKRPKKAILTGMTGQDGSYLAELLLAKDYEVHGIIRGCEPEEEMQRIDMIKNHIQLHLADFEKIDSLIDVMRIVQPSECYHFAAKSFVHYSLNDALPILNVNINTTFNILASIKEAAPGCRFFFAGSSEMFGIVKNCPQDEATMPHPRSPYGISKSTGFNLVRYFRESMGLYACSGILYNHESPRRGKNFVTRKITLTAAKIKLGLATELRLGNLDAKRDWGYAGDYVDAMWRMLQHSEPDDFIISSGEIHSVKKFVQIAFDYLELDWKKYVIVDKKYFRPAESIPLSGSYQKANNLLGWQPQVTFHQLVRMMVDADMESL